MVEYIPLGIFRSSFKFCMGDKLREKMEGGKGMERFSVYFKLHKPIQIVFFKNFENCSSPFKNETLYQESSEDR
jgi:hypothetical protein